MTHLLLFTLLFTLCSFTQCHCYFDPQAPPMPITQRAINAWKHEEVMRSWNLQRSTPTFSIDIVAGSPPIAVTNAILYAAALMNSFFVPPVPITFALSWTDLSPINVNLLGESASYTTCAHPDAAHFTYVKVPSALYSFLTLESNCPSVVSPYHGSISINSNPPAPWFTAFGGSTPLNQIDLITVVLHEMMHAMGFETFMEVDGSYSLAPYGFIFDWYLFANTSNGWPSNFTSAISSPAISDSSVLTSSVQFHGTVSVDGTSTFDVYTPGTFLPGTSLAHVAPPSTIMNHLMFPSLGHGQAWHNIGPDVWIAMSTMGYAMHPYSLLSSIPSGTSSASCLQNIFFIE